MHTWITFLLFPLLIFITLFFIYAMIGLSLTLGCGFSPDAQFCSKIFYLLFAVIFLSAIWLGYLSTKLAPPIGKFLLSNAYNLILSTILIVFFYDPKVSNLKLFGFGIIFFVCAALGSLIFYLKHIKIDN